MDLRGVLMSLRARRPLLLLLLGILFADPATPADAATPTSGGSAGYQRASAGTTKAPTRRRARRRARRPPPGGVYARHAVVIDPATDEILYEKNAAVTVPIASLSKLMTMLVFLEQKPDLDRWVDVTRADLLGAGHTQLRNQEQLPLRDLLHMSLMCSDNVATRVLVRESGLSADDFLARMNRGAVELGLARTRFVEFTGLDERNVASAADCARLLRAAAAQPLIRDIMTTRTYEFRTQYRNRGRMHFISNTNRLLYGRYEILGGKTGFISEAGYCLATWVHTQGRDMIAVVLGAPTPATRFADVVRLVQRTSTPSAPRAN
jgi:D-alanyl-D-alanine endopeptidase (penicillin-binding protein 7)